VGLIEQHLRVILRDHQLYLHNSNSSWEQHVGVQNNLFKVPKLVHWVKTLDLSSSVYSTGNGYTWGVMALIVGKHGLVLGHSNHLVLIERLRWESILGLHHPISVLSVSEGHFSFIFLLLEINDYIIFQQFAWSEIHFTYS